MHDTTNVFTLYEIMPDQLRKEMANGVYTCFFCQTPHCHGEHCKPLTYYSKLLASPDSMYVQTLLTSPSYEYDIMEQEKERFRYDGLMCVMDKDAYGGHKYNSQKLFTEQVSGHKIKGKDMLGCAHYYVFRSDSLVSYGLEQADAVNYIREHQQ